MPRNGGSRVPLAGNASALDGSPTYSGVASSSRVPKGSRTNATRWPCGLSSGAASDVIPFRGWIRKLSGAERHDKYVQAAITAGAVRRAYLKGLDRKSVV